VSPGYVSSGLRREIHQRALGRCEYCLLSQEDAFFPHEPDHVIAEKHGGATTIENLALACFDCNSFKGSDIASIDPDTGNLVALFNPRSRTGTNTFH
jgi:5-methylcytosine-specific restriction endonuclease McrA